MKHTSSNGPLAGLKVLDLTRVLAGPWATQVLADFGADIWKIENPDGGDETRHWGAQLPKNLAGDKHNLESLDTQSIEYKGKMTAYYLSANRGKYSITVNIASTKGQEIIKQLVQSADILVENFKLGNLEKYGLDYKSLSKLNSKLVYCSITGFGQTGAYADQAGYDAMIQASAGLMSITGEKNGAPQKVGVAVSDLMTGMYAVSAILAAIYHRNKTGVGQYIDLALFDTQVSWLANQSMNYLLGGEIPEKQGSIHPNISPYQPVNCKDGLIMLAIGNDRQFKACCEQLELFDLSSDSLFKTNNLRVKNSVGLIFLMEKVFKTRTCQHWLTALSKCKVPCGPINNIKQVFEHPQITARNILFSLNHPQVGEIPQVANPVKFSNTVIDYPKAAPSLGEDTKYILEKELGFSDTEMEELERLGVI